MDDMRILGNGVDIVENRRIEKAIKNKNFVNIIFSSKEKDIAKKKRVNKTNYFGKKEDNEKRTATSN